MPIKLVVLDMAGTTVADDDAVAKAFIQAFGRQGFTLTSPEISPLMGYKKTEAIRIVLERLGTQPAEPEKIDQIHEDFTREMIRYYTTSPAVQPTPYAGELLQELKKRGIQVAMNTGFPRSIADTLMDRMGWVRQGLVDRYIASDEVPAGRPQPLMIQNLMAHAGITDPREVAKIGDTEVDVHEGRNAGCGLVVAVTTGAFTREALLEHQPDFIIDSLAELPALID
ncbi:MAG TPA: HAD family hydrolase [Chitinophagaceae bacterium]|nr:HAD family hydrolase [Chitinophagaceae bacterium]